MKNNIILLATAFIFSFILLLFILFPDASYQAAKSGVDIWFYNVFPALLPFFIGTELLIGLGVVHFLGILLEPIMYPLFNVPGTGSFALAMSITSGYPMGSKITTDLRSRKLCSQVEGQRLLALCSTSGPLFMIGAVAVGMFHNPSLGVVIAIAHYTGSILTGLCFRNYGIQKNTSGQKRSKNYSPIQALYQARKEDGRKFGVLLGDAVKNSVNTLLIIGGFIILFSVLIELFSTLKLFDFLSLLLSPLLRAFHASDLLIKGLLSGILEITNGANIISQSTDPLIKQAIFTSFVIAWGGFSIHAQAISIISKTDLKISPYLIAKLLHGIFSGISCYFIMKWIFPLTYNQSTPVFFESHQSLLLPLNWINTLLISMEFYFINLVLLFFLGLVLFLILNKKPITFFQKKS